MLVYFSVSGVSMTGRGMNLHVLPSSPGEGTGIAGNGTGIII